MQLISENVTRAIGRTILKTKKNSPHILFAGGLLGVVGSTILACRATLKLDKNLDEARRDLEEVKQIKEMSYNEKEYYRDLTYVYVKTAVRFGRLYGPSLVLGSASVAALTGSHIQLTRRNAALSTTLALVSKAYDDYRERVREELGKEKELDLHNGLVTKEIEVDGKMEKRKIFDPNKMSPYARFFDETCIEWVNNNELNRIFLQCQQNYANHLLRARGHVFLNEVYDSLGLERSRAGAVVGWVIDGDGDGFVDFGIFDVTSNRFVNGIEKSILLDFNVDGVIYDKI